MEGGNPLKLGKETRETAKKEAGNTEEERRKGKGRAVRWGGGKKTEREKGRE